jgi:hypothetical protein
LQRELVDEGRKFEETATGQAVLDQAMRQTAELKARLVEI